jgi:spermidine/putrescine ABC transporter ATP-binding subunit
MQIPLTAELEAQTNSGMTSAQRSSAISAYLQVQDLVVHFGDHTALNLISFNVVAGERLCLLGPSGCGKTTCLRVIAGFIVPHSGQVDIAGKSMLSVPPEHRNIGILFQSYALFPHLNVHDNVAFGLRMRSLPEAAIKQKVADALNLVRLPRSGDKRPSMLSGGEQQRIAFARAIVIQPSLLLLDEPFSNLDARLRQEMRSELLELLERLAITTVMVTHDQEEAMSIADRIVVMRAGKIEQVGTPRDIYEHPCNEFVARFVGESNSFGGIARVGPGQTFVDVAGLGTLVASGGVAVQRSGQVRVLFRPEKIRLSARGSASRTTTVAQRFDGTVERVQYIGHRSEYRIRVAQRSIIAWRMNERSPTLEPGDKVDIEWDQADTLIFDDGAEK